MPSFDAAILALSPDVYWRMDQDPLSGAGGSCLDASGNGRHGTYATVPTNLTGGQSSLVPSNPNAISVAVADQTYVEGSSGTYAFARDSKDDWWDSSIISASICFRLNSNGNSTRYLFRRDHTDPVHRQFGLRVWNDTDLRLDYAIVNPDTGWRELDTVNLLNTVNIQDGNPHIATIVIDYNASRLEIWVDGVLAANSAPVEDLRIPTDTFMAVGQARIGTGGHSINGGMSHFVFGGRAWTTQEIQDLHAAWAASQILPPTPLPTPGLCANTCPPGTPPTGDSVTCIPRP